MMYRYPLNGRPAAFYRGDWFVGKGVACARIRIGSGEKDVVEVFNTHLHAPYEVEPHDSYICHRTAQAWEIAKLMRHAAERGHLVLGLGDFNMVPLSLAHQLIEAHAPVKDVWRIMKPESAIGSYEVQVTKEGGRGVSGRCPSAQVCVDEHGTTCDSKFNTWRWSKQMQKKLDKGQDTIIDPETEDPSAKRLDYIFFGDNSRGNSRWRVQDVAVGMTMRHPELKCSLSDHFSIETTLVRETVEQHNGNSVLQSTSEPLPQSLYQLVQSMISSYDLRERHQRRLRIGHFFFQLSISIGCLIAVWWSPRNFVAFILMLVSTLGLSVGVIDGLMGFLFVGSELRALREFKYELDIAMAQAAKRVRMKQV